MFIKISNLSEGIHNYSFDEPVKKIELGEPFFGNFLLKVELVKSLNQIIMDAQINLLANFDCDRCTKNFDRMIDTKYKMVYMFGQKPMESDSININYLQVDADKIDLTNDLRDYSLLSIPMKKLCKEDCKGLCYHCGKDLNEDQCDCNKTEIDTRWHPLLELKNKLKTN